MRLNNRSWGLALLGGWTVFVASVWLWNHRPVTWWFDPGPVTVADARAGECPAMTYSRAIRRPFHGAWRVTLLRESPGGWYVARLWIGENDYRPDVALPPADEMDLGWWVQSDRCDLAPGRYRILTAWQVNPRSAGVRDVSVMSNEFTVHPWKGTP
jgi:hypothetical protein